MTYPNFIEDREGLNRWRERAREGDGHEMVANKNTVHRFVQTVDLLEARALKAERLLNGLVEACRPFAEIGAQLPAMSGDPCHEVIGRDGLRRSLRPAHFRTLALALSEVGGEGGSSVAGDADAPRFAAATDAQRKSEGGGA